MLLHFENLELVLSVIMSVYEKLKPVFRSPDFAEFKLDSNQFKRETSRMFTRRTKEIKRAEVHKITFVIFLWHAVDSRLRHFLRQKVLQQVNIFWCFCPLALIKTLFESLGLLVWHLRPGIDFHPFLNKTRGSSSFYPPLQHKNFLPVSIKTYNVVRFFLWTLHQCQCPSLQ